MATENKVEKQIVEFARSLGWTAWRQQSGVFKTEHGGRVRIGIEGLPDWRFHRPVSRGVVQVFHCEVKSPGKKPQPKQLEVMASLEYLGEVAFWADSLDSFKQQYYVNFTEYDNDRT